MSKKRPKGDVAYILPGKKRPAAYSPLIVSNEIVCFARDGLTVRQVYDALIYSPDGRAVLQKYIDAGYGDTEASILFW